MDHPDLTVSNLMESPIGLKGLKALPSVLHLLSNFISMHAQLFSGGQILGFGLEASR